jgi:hypothetical protein
MAMTKKNKNKKINPFIRILLSVILIFGIYHSFVMLSLSFFGETTLGVLDSYDSRRDDAKAGENQSRMISKTYHFSVNGKEYRGSAYYSGDEVWPSLQENEFRTERISYFTILPNINKPTHLVDIDELGPMGLLYYTLRIPLCLFLLLLVNGWLGKRKKRIKKTKSTEKLNRRRDDTMFCGNCGTKLPEDAAFCINCGAPVHKAREEENNPSSQATTSTQDKSLVGWSPNSNDPEILEAARKNKKSAIGCAWIFMLFFPIGFLLAGLFIDEMPLNEAIIIGVGLGVLMLVINLWRIKDMKAPLWEGVVTEKYKKERREHKKDDNMTTYTEYTTIIKTEGGKEKRITEKDSGRHMYDYLAVGERVRYHPSFGTYEKYDKSKDRIIYCNVCSMMNPISNDRCKRCNNLLFK